MTTESAGVFPGSIRRWCVATYENLCDGAQVVLELVVSVYDGTADKDLWLRHDCCVLGTGG